MVPAPSPNPLIGLLVSAILIVFTLWSIRRSSKKQPTFHPCRICKENIRFSVGFQGGMRGHFKTVHPEYWKSLKRWTVAGSVAILASMFSIFPLLIYNIIPSRGPPSILTPIGITVWGALTFSIIGVTMALQKKTRRRFRDEWVEKHPLYQRTYGNLRGIEVDIRFVQGKTRTAIMSGLEFLFNPIAPAFSNLAAKLVEHKARRSILDRFEDGRLWFYSGLDQLVSLDVRDVPPEMVDEQRLEISLRKGQTELKTENSADLHLVLSILNPARASPTTRLTT